MSSLLPHARNRRAAPLVLSGLLAVLSSFAMLGAAPATALAVDGAWGPDQVPYGAGVVCTSATFQQSRPPEQHRRPETVAQPTIQSTAHLRNLPDAATRRHHAHPAGRSGHHRSGHQRSSRSPEQRTITDETALVAWTFDGGRPAFAAGPITGTFVSDGTSSALEPATDGSLVPVTPTSGFGLSAATIRSAAYLIGAFGESGQAQVGEIADLVSDLTSSNPAGDACVASGADGMSPGDRQALWAQAMRSGGPYHVTVSAADPKITLGRPESLIATVTSAGGNPVPGLTVSFSASAGKLPHGTRATTDGDGQAEVALVVPHNSTLRAVQARATVTAPVGLDEASSAGRVPVLLAADPQRFSDTARLPIDTTAAPALTTAFATHTSLPGNHVTATATVTGLRGHLGRARLTVTGPVAFPAGGCAALSAPDWRAAARTAGATQLAGTLAGDGTVTAPLTLSAPGCYAVTGSVTATNAVPVATGNSGWRVAGRTLAVLPVSFTTSTADGHGVTTNGPQTGTVSVHSSDPDVPVRLTGVGATLYGTQEARYGHCPTTGWTTRPTHAGLTISGQGSGTVTVTSSRQTADACFAYGFTGTIDAGAEGSVAFRVTPGSPGTTILLTHPTVDLTGDGTGDAIVGHSVTATVTVYGTWSQPAELAIRLVPPTEPDAGCTVTGWQPVSSGILGPAITTSGDGVYQVTSPALPGNMCYSMVPVLTLVANPQVQVSGPVGNSAGFAFGKPPKPALSPLAGGATPDHHGLPWVGVGIASGVVLGIAIIATVFAAWRATRAQRREGTGQRWLI